MAVERGAGWGRLTLVSKNTRFRCPRCRIAVGDGQPCRPRRLRDLDIGRRHMEVRVQVYRVWCRTCGRPEVPVTLARRYARCTRRLEEHLFRLTGDSTVKAVAKRMALDWDTVKDAEIRYVRGLLRKQNPDGITRIGIDEVSYETGHKYLTLVTHLDGRRVIYATHGNDGKAVGRFLTWLGAKRCRRIKVVVTDMHDPYLKVLRNRLPQVALVFDHFHVSKIVHDALDDVRRRLQRVGAVDQQPTTRTVAVKRQPHARESASGHEVSNDPRADGQVCGCALGIKGVGESGTLPVAAALASAIEDAIGRPILHMPVTPARLHALLASEPRRAWTLG